jgi:AraC-like DNA-binding protein
MDLYSRIVRAKLYIDENYAAPLDLDKLSDEACFSKFHFLRLFKRAYNRTPYQYVSERRIQKAKERLANDDRKITEICEEIGFESKTSFTSKFKAYTGETPALFRLRSMQTKKLLETEPDRFVPSCFSTQYAPTE